MSVWNFKDLTGQKFGRLTVIERAENSSQGKAHWLCKCDCGNLVEVSSVDLTHNKVKSCGCAKKDVNITHGMSQTKIYETWCGIKKTLLR